MANFHALLLVESGISFSATPNNGTRSQNVSPTPSEMSMVSMVDFETSILDESIRRVSFSTKLLTYLMYIVLILKASFEYRYTDLQKADHTLLKAKLLKSILCQILHSD